MKRINIFIRDDDVSRLTERFIKFHEFMMSSKTPVIYAVIPSEVDGETVNFLLEEKKKHGDLIEIVQHGWSHTNHGSKTDKYEFGDSREYLQQKKDIIMGKRKMEELFGSRFLRDVFVPPFHGYNQDTLGAIKEAGITVFSAYPGAKNQHLPEVINLPVQISLNLFELDGTPHILPLKEMLKQLNYWDKKPKSHNLGVNIHHETLDENDFSDFKKFIKLLKSKRNLEFTTFGAILAGELKTNKNNLFQAGNITIELTNMCNLRCRMCNIWKEPKKSLSFSDVNNLLLSSRFARPIESVSLTGGECILHPDFNKIFRFLILLHMKKVIKDICVVSNAYDYNRLNLFLRKNENHQKRFSLVFSMDGLEKNHDAQRGVKGAFGTLMNSIDLVREEFPNIDLNVKFTITNLNYKDLPAVYDFCRNKKIKLSVKVVEEGNNQYYHRTASGEDQIFKFSKEQKSEISRTLLGILTSESRNEFTVVSTPYLKIIIAELHGTNKVKKCLTPNYSLFVTSSGDIYPCLYEKPISNLHLDNWEENILSEQHKSIINKALKGKCQGCTAYHGFLKEWNV